MRHLPAILFAIAFGVPLAAISVVAQELGSWFLSDPWSTPPDQLDGAVLFILPAAFVGLVAGAALGRRGAVVLLVPLGEIVVILLNVVKGPPWTDGWSDRGLAPLLATCAVPYAVGWGVGWAIRIRGAASRSKQVLTSGPNWTSPDVKHPT